MSLRPSNPPSITLDDLKPGDVLLSAGSNWLDTLIKFIDEGDYSHATQYIGKIKNPDGKVQHMVVEATESGIKYQSTEADFDAQDLIDAYRYVSPGGHHFGDDGWPVQPVLDKAKSFVGAKYAYSELLMGAVAIMASEVPKNKNLKEALRIAIDYVDHKFQKWLDENSDKVPMTCVQVVTSAHWLADSTPANKYGIQVSVDGSRRPPGDNLNDQQKAYAELRSRLIKKMQSAFPKFKLAQRTDNDTVHFAGSEVLPLGTCTPRDMETSPTLTFVGCLKDTRA